MGWLRKTPLLLLVCLAVLLADQASKLWAVGELTRAFEVEAAETLGEKLRAFRVMRYLEPLRRAPIPVIEDAWRFRYLENPGAAWGILGSVDPAIRLPFFRSAPLAAMALLGFLYFRAAGRQRALRLSLAMVLGGALGNFVDRWLHGYVIDFIDWQLLGYRWPTFNVADVAISLGVLGVATESLRSALRRRRSQGELIVATEPTGEGESAPSLEEAPPAAEGDEPIPPSPSD